MPAFMIYTEHAKMDTTLTAIVIASIPDTGLALVQDTAMRAGSNALLIGILPVHPQNSGVNVYTAYPVGALVSCTHREGSPAGVVYIQGILGGALDPLSDGYLGRHLGAATPVENLAAARALSWFLLERCSVGKDRLLIRNHSNGTDPDIHPGDLDILDRETQVGLHIGGRIASLRAGYMASVDVLAGVDKIRITGCEIGLHTLTSETVFSPSYSVRNTATSVSEAFGLRNEGVVTEQRQGALSLLLPTKEDALPLYRIQHMEGMAIGGVEDTITDFPTTGYHTANNPPALLYKHRRSLSGRVTEVSACGLASIKTPFVNGIVQVGYNKTPLKPAIIQKEGKLVDSDVIDDLREPFDLGTSSTSSDKTDLNNKSVTEDDKVTDAAINKLVDNLLSGDYSKALIGAMARHGFSKTEADTALGARFNNKTVIGGATNAQHYALPASISNVDPASGATTTYYNSTSFISQEPDGSICIADGYGSEIRMCRGNIYIAPALDLIFRPGRNMYGMVPGHISLNAQQRCDLESGTDAVTLRAAGDVKLASGADDSGAHRGNVTIENLSKGGGDIYIRSTGNMAVTARQSMLLGKDPESDTACHMQIDTGAGGALYMRGEQATLESAQTVIGGLSQGSDTASGSALVVDQSQISLLSQLVSAPAHLYMNREEKRLTVGVVRGGVKKAANIATATGGDVIVDGNLIVNKQLAVNEGAALKFVVTAGLTETDEEYYKKHNHVEVAANKNIVTGAGDSSAQVCETLGKSIYSKKTLAETTFKYPDTYGVQMDTMPGMLWQQRSAESGNPGNKWKEPEVNGTLPFPGKKVWDSAKISETGYKKEATLKSDYVTNN